MQIDIADERLAIPFERYSARDSMNTFNTVSTKRAVFLRKTALNIVRGRAYTTP
jgi:hypothetical protein